MSLAEACYWTLLRSLIIASVAVPICLWTGSAVQSLPGRWRRIAWGLLLIPFFTPEMLMGYAYYNFALSLIHHPLLGELFYASLLFFKVFPVGTVIAHFAPPPPISHQALHCRRLALQNSSNFVVRARAMWGVIVRGPLRAALPVFALTFLLSFQEFDLVSLLNATSWTVWLFDQQAQGLPLLDTLGYSVAPLVCTMIVLAIAVPGIFASRARPGLRKESRIAASNFARAKLGVILCFGLLLTLVVPSWFVLSGTLAGMDVLRRNPRLVGEIATGLGMAMAATIPTYGLAWWLMPTGLHGSRQRGKLLACLVLAFPGLTGTLTLSLALLSLFQLPVLNRFYDTPLPWLAASILYLFPRALLLQVLLGAARRREPIHLVALLRRSNSPKVRKRVNELDWQLRFRGHFWAMVLTGWWTYLDPTIPSLLRPSGLDPAPMRLYNFMHYGQATGLSAMLAVTLTAPALLVAAMMPSRRVLMWLRDRLGFSPGVPR